MSTLNRLCVLLTIACVVAGCSPARLLGGFTFSDQQTVMRGLMYGERPDQLLDLYLPTSQSQARPLIVFVYGGGWRSGSRSDFRFVANTLNRAGYGVAIPDYAQYPAHRFPVFVDDIAQAVSWLRQQTQFQAIDTERIVLMGHSAGAHITALVATDRQYLQKQGLNTDVLTGWIGIAGPYDFIPFTRDYMFDLFPASVRQQSQPINYVDASDPPALLLQGTDDSVVLPRNSIRLHSKLQMVGGNSTLKLYPNTGHRRIVVALSPLLRNIAPTLHDVLEFLDALQETNR